MFENIIKTLKNLIKREQQQPHSKDTARERLHLVLMQDRANVSADFLELMKQEIIDVIKKYIDVDEAAIDVRLTNKVDEDGKAGAPFLYANIPVVNIKSDFKKENVEDVGVGAEGDLKEDVAKPEKTEDKEEKKEDKKEPEKKDDDEPEEKHDSEEPAKKNIHGIRKQNKNFKRSKTSDILLIKRKKMRNKIFKNIDWTILICIMLLTILRFSSIIQCKQRD